jgi:hypothetical protein
MSQEYSKATPCRHADAPSEFIIQKIVNLLENEIPRHPNVLTRVGMTVEEYQTGYRAAIQSYRGRISASDQLKKTFVESILQAGVASGAFANFTLEGARKTNVYRVELPSGKVIGILKKGCPDGDHNARWERPDWVDELYLWWLCPDSRVHEPGESVWKGIGRVKAKMLLEPDNYLDGVMFFDEACGSDVRPCPKRDYGLTIEHRRIPPPCIYVLPGRLAPSSGRVNWRGERKRFFPEAILSVFGVPAQQSAHYLGFVGFDIQGVQISRVRIESSYGQGRITSVTA